MGRIGSRKDGQRIAAAMIYSAMNGVTGSITPGETVLVLGELAKDGYCKVMWRSGTWWVHSAFIEEVEDEQV